MKKCLQILEIEYLIISPSILREEHWTSRVILTRVLANISSTDLGTNKHVLLLSLYGIGTLPGFVPIYSASIGACAVLIRDDG